MKESPLFPRGRCEEIFGRVQQVAHSLGVRQVEAILGAGAEALTRFANNAIHQNVAEENHHVSIRVLLDRRTARVTTNRLDSEAIRSAVERAVTIARSSEADPDLLPLFTPESVTDVDRYSPRTAACSPADRAQAVARAIHIIESQGQVAAGIYSTGESVEALLNSEGVFAYHSETSAVFSITAMSADSSGWAKESATDLAAFDPEQLAARAADKARLSASPREIAPGPYTVILEPAAVLDLVGQFAADFSATAVADQRSCLTDRLTEALLGSNITLYDDVFHPAQSGAPFDGEGVPRQRLTLVSGGTPSQLPCCRAIARKLDSAPTGHGYPLPNEDGESPLNLVLAGGDVPLDRMIAGTRRGILVTRLWYIREVDPYEKILTGMTRDGTFLIERGEIAGGIRNFRFNQGLLEMLRQVESLSPAVRASGEEAFDMVVPAMKVHQFQFTEVTRF